jgi:hypothetical protein
MLAPLNFSYFNEIDLPLYDHRLGIAPREFTAASRKRERISLFPRLNQR